VGEGVSGEQRLADDPLAVETKPTCSVCVLSSECAGMGERFEERLRCVEAGDPPGATTKRGREGTPPVHRHEDGKRSREDVCVAEQLEPQDAVAEGGDEAELARERPQLMEPTRRERVVAVPWPSFGRNGRGSSRGSQHAATRDDP